jgi:hypothetical protein
VVDGYVLYNEASSHIEYSFDLEQYIQNKPRDEKVFSHNMV